MKAVLKNQVRLVWALRGLAKARNKAEIKFLISYILKGFILNRSSSQCMQDYFAQFMVQASATDERFFVEVGANHWRFGSNTFKLEKQGWRGLLIEPNPVLAAELVCHRSAQIVTTAVSDVDGRVVNLVVPHGDHGIARLDQTSKDDRSDDDTEVFEVTTSTLSSILSHNSAPSHIHFMSIDVEGHEVQVLRGLDFGRYSFDCITIEHNYDAARLHELDEILSSNGYRRKWSRISFFDAWYVKETTSDQ